MQQLANASTLNEVTVSSAGEVNSHVEHSHLKIEVFRERLSELTDVRHQKSVSMTVSHQAL